MTRRILAAMANPHLDILGHCTGRLVVGRGRPESTFDAQAVFEGGAVRQGGRDQLAPRAPGPAEAAADAGARSGCRFAIDSDAHAPGQLSWLRYGASRRRAKASAIDRIVNTMAPTT